MKKESEQVFLTLNEKQLATHPKWTFIAGIFRDPKVRSAFIKLLLLTVIYQITMVILPLNVQFTVDYVIDNHNVDLLFVLFIAVLLIVCVHVFSLYAKQVILSLVGQTIADRIMCWILQRLFKKEFSFFASRAVGDISARFFGALHIQEFVVGKSVTFFVDFITVLLTLMLLLTYSYKSVLALLIFVCIIFPVNAWALKKKTALLTVQSENDAMTASDFIESITGMTTVKINAMTSKRYSGWVQKRENFSLSAIHYNVYDVAVTAFLTFMNYFVWAVVIYILSIDVLHGRLSLGMAMSFLTYQTFFVQSIKSVIDAWSSYRLLDVHINRFLDLVDIQEQEKDHDQQQVQSSIPDNIHMKNITYVLPNGTTLFQNLTLEIESHNIVVITGASGSGKSTLLKLMLGLLTPTQGDVYYGNRALSELDKESCYQKIGVVLQEDALFAGTIAQNITCFADDVDSVWLKKSLEFACLWDEVKALPMGVDTPLGEQGAGLSGGQKQRIMLARAFYKKPILLFLDEGTSYLDAEIEQQVNDNIKVLGITCVIVAHRPDVLRVANKVLHINNRGVLEEV